MTSSETKLYSLRDNIKTACCICAVLFFVHTYAMRPKKLNQTAHKHVMNGKANDTDNKEGKKTV